MLSVENTDPVRAFVEDACTVRMQSEITSELIFAAFVRWTEVHGHKQTPDTAKFYRRFQIALEQQFGTSKLIKKPKIRTRDGKPRRGWANLHVDPSWLTPTLVDRDADDRFLRSFQYDDGPGATDQEPAPSKDVNNRQLELSFD